MIREFIYKYYIDPIRYGQPYTLVDTLTYALILLVCVWLVYRWLESYKISVDRKFVYALLPWIIFGGVLRVVEDTGVVANDLYVLLTTPLIFFVIFAIAMPVLYLSSRLERMGKISSCMKMFGSVGLALTLGGLIFLIWFGVTSSHLNLIVGVIILAMTGLSSAILYYFMKYGFKWSFVSDRLYQILIAGHMLDASATSYGIDLHAIPYVEQHVVGAAMIELTGTAFVMFPLKLIVLIPGIYILEIYRREGASGIWYLILLAMIMVGLAPGVRSLLRMVLYV